jgi:hypothetical protein
VTKPARFTQRDVEMAVRGAIRGGLQPGSFSVVLSSATGELRILPAAAGPAQGDALDDELAAWRARNGDG